jgi:hypothetical protein
MLSEKWRSARPSSPCPVCGRPDWCQITADGRGAICRRIQSGKPQKKGGWFHHVTGATRAVAPPPTQETRPERHDFELLQRSFATAVHPDRLARLAADLQLSVESLRRLEIGWAGERYFCDRPECKRRRHAWTFPMRRHPNVVAGIRLRFVECGHKTSVKGSDGHALFVPRDLCEDRLFVCEGPTDTAALLDMELPAIGRPSCGCGLPHIIKFIKTRFIAHLVIVGDLDEAKLRVKDRPDLGVWYPGQQGATTLAAAARPYCRDVRLIYPPAGVGKDVRKWKQQGATAADVEQLVAAAEPYTLTIKSQQQASNNNSTSMEGVKL